MNTKQLREIREAIAKECGLESDKDVKCYRCKKWGYNCGKYMNTMGESRCMAREGKEKTASFNWCKRFEYVGNGK